MFPGNLTIKLMWENACGYLQKGKMHNIVTSGDVYKRQLLFAFIAYLLRQR